MIETSLLQRTHWVFDLDGTLTIPVHDFMAIRAELGLPKDMGILEAIATMPEEQASRVTQQLDEIEIELARQSKPAQGTQSLLTTLHQRGCRLGILTRNSRANALLTIEAIGVLSYFDHECILGRDEVVHKPDPDGVLKLVDHWQTTPADTIVVGDYLFDLQAGRAAGAATIHVDLTSSFPWPEWMNLGVSTLQELSEKLDNPNHGALD